jgi:hypothetical protein
MICMLDPSKMMLTQSFTKFFQFIKNLLKISKYHTSQEQDEHLLMLKKKKMANHTN